MENSMRIIYLQSTLNLLIQHIGLENVKTLTESGEIKQTETLINYLVTQN